MNTDINKTKWKCRRGLRELDLLFRRYSEAKLDSLSKEEFEMFNSILDLEDQALYDFIFKNESLNSPEKESFILNKDPFTKAKILIAGKNFGCGSSREHAPWSILDFGIKVIIAPSFADIFFNNCFKNGILPIKLSEDKMYLGDIPQKSDPPN